MNANKALALMRIVVLDPARPMPTEEAITEAWANLAWAKDARLSPHATHTMRASLKANESLTEALGDIGCNAQGGPYVVQGLLWNLENRFKPKSSEPAKLAAAFLDEANCPGARGLSEEDKARLKEIRGPIPPTSDQPTASPE